MSEITISLDKSRLDIDVIYNFLSTAYWSGGRTKSMMRTTIENSICFGVFDGQRQIGFARVVSDKVVFGYIMDVFIIEEYQGKGHGSELMDFILSKAGLCEVQNWMLATSDAHGLYEKFGFEIHPDSGKIMSR